MNRKDTLTPLFALIGVAYLKSIDIRHSYEYREKHSKMLESLVKEFHEHIRNATEPDIQIIKK